MKLLILVALLLLPFPALAQFVSPYNNGLYPSETYAQMPGGAVYRDERGKLHYEYVPTPMTRESHSMQTPAPQPTPPSRYQTDRYELLRDTTPGSSYRSDSIFSER